MELYGAGSTFFLLVFGIVLTFITLRRMITGSITLPLWAKILSVAAMILSLLVILLSILPPLQIPVEDFFIDEQTHIVYPAESVNKDIP